MARANITKTSFSAGELSPRLLGRADLDRYRDGAETLENVVPLREGGVQMREGLAYTIDAGDHSAPPLLIPFVFSAAERYLLELGDEYLRILDGASRAPMRETAKAITGATQGNPVVLTVTAHGYADGDTVFVTGLAGGMSQLNGRTFDVANATANTFSLTDTHGDDIDGSSYDAYGAGGTVARVYTLETGITQDMLSQLDYVQGADTLFLVHQAMPMKRLRRFSGTYWVLDDLPLDPEPFDEIGHSFGVALTLSAATVGTARTVTAGSGIFQTGDVGREIVYLGGVLKITGFTSSTQVSGDVTAAFPSTAVPASVWTLNGSPRDTLTPSAKDPIGASVNLTATSLDIWRSADVGKHVRINGGIVEITGFSSATVVSGIIRQVLTGTAAAAADAWSLEAAVWSPENGYPSCCTLHQQRLVVGGTRAFPATIWGSAVGEYGNFFLGANDADAFGYTLGADQINPLQHLSSTSHIFALTLGGEFTMRGGIEKPITPTNVQVESQSGYGCANIRPVRAGKDMIFVQRAGLKLRAFSYDASGDSFDSEDLTLLAGHVSGGGFRDMSYRQEPEPLVYLPRADGQLVTLSMADKRSVLAFARQITDGAIERVATLPSDAGDETYCVVRRTIAGRECRFIERFTDAALLDCHAVATGAASTIWGGFWHLEGQAVTVMADGASQGTKTVSGGSITLNRAAQQVAIGLAYVPTVRLLTPEFSTDVGSIQGDAMSTSEVTVRVLNTYSLKVNGKNVPLRRFGASVLDRAPPAVTGLLRLSQLGWERGTNDLVLSGESGLPWHVVAVTRTLTANG